jgi:hypothetical protein
MRRRFSLLCGVLSLGCGDDPKRDSAGPGVTSGQVFSGTASMLFDGPACTREEGTGADRWCAFVARAENGDRKLFAVNVSALLAGEAVTCGNADEEHCVLLTPSLGGDSFDPTHHGTLFQGDTLVYYDSALAPFAWRPGMPSGKLLMEVSEALDAVFCTPAARGSVVGCLGLPAEQAEPDLARADLFVGHADGAGEPLLSAVDAVIAANAADAIPRFGYGFPDVPGDYVAWTTRESATGPETLKLVDASDPASKVTVAVDVHEWSLSLDRARWYWLRAIDAFGAGTLQTAPFPGGENSSDVSADVVQYAEAPARGALVVRTRDAELVAIADPLGAPGERVTLDTGVLDLLSVTNAGHVAYVKHFVGASAIDLFVAGVRGDGTCTLDTSVSVPLRSVFFSPDGDSVVWARANESGGFDGYYTDLASCSSEPLAAGVVALAWLGDQTVLVINDFDDGLGVGSLRVRAVARDNRLEPAEAELVAEAVDTYAITDPGRRTLVYTVNGDGPADGVYVQRF